MVVLIQSQACQRCSDDCISVRKEGQCVTTPGQHCSISSLFISLGNLKVLHHSTLQTLGSKFSPVRLVLKVVIFCLGIALNFSKMPFNLMWDG